MMKTRIFLKVLIAHVVIIGAFLVVGFAKDWFKPKPIPAMDVVMVSDPFAPQSDVPAPLKPVVEEQPAPKPPPPKPAEPEPEPVVEKPKWEATKAKDIVLNKKIIRKETKPPKRQSPPPKPVVKRRENAFDPSKFEKIASSSDSTPIVQRTTNATPARASDMAIFAGRLKAAIEAKWNRPPAFDGGRKPVAVVEVTVYANGRVSGARLHTPSLYPALNDSALKAAMAVTRISGVPDGFPASKTYLVDVELR